MVAFIVAVFGLLVALLIGANYINWLYQGTGSGFGSIVVAFRYVFYYLACFTVTSFASLWVMKSESRVGGILMFLNVLMASLFFFWNVLIE